MTHLPDRDLTRLAAHIEANGTASGFVPTPKKKRKNEESIMQRQLVLWWARACRGFGVPELCLFSVPNGFNGDARRGSVMKAEGQRRGVPDVMVAVSRFVGPEGANHGDRYFGLFLELKTATGRLSPEQEVYHEILAAEGYRVAVVRSLDEAIKTVTEYLNS
jgi:hypothetical protein